MAVGLSSFRLQKSAPLLNSSSSVFTVTIIVPMFNISTFNHDSWIAMEPPPTTSTAMHIPLLRRTPSQISPHLMRFCRYQTLFIFPHQRWMLNIYRSSFVYPSLNRSPRFHSHLLVISRLVSFKHLQSQSQSSSCSASTSLYSMAPFITCSSVILYQFGINSAMATMIVNKLKRQLQHGPFLWMPSRPMSTLFSTRMFFNCSSFNRLLVRRGDILFNMVKQSRAL